MENNEKNEQINLISGIKGAIKAFFSPKPHEVINVVMNHKSSLGYTLAAAYVLASTLASSVIASTPVRVANSFFLLEIEMSYGELLYRGFTFGALTFVVFVACVHFYLSTLSREMPLVKTINFVAAFLLPATLFLAAACFLGFLHLIIAIIVIGFGILSSLLLAVFSISKVTGYPLPLTWSALLYFGAAIIIYVWLFVWTTVTPAITGLIGF